MGKGGGGWNNSQNAQNKMNGSIDKNLSRRKTSTKSRQSEFADSVKESKREKRFFEIYETFSSWEIEIIGLMGISYDHIMVEMRDFCDDVSKKPGGSRDWVYSNLYKNQISPKLAKRKLKEKVYG